MENRNSVQMRLQ